MKTMTIGELKELLSTWGANEVERNAPVLVNIHQTPTPVLSEAEVLSGPDWTSPQDPGYIAGPFLLLQAADR